MKIGILKEKRPFSYKNVFTWYDAGTEFEILEEKEIIMMGTGYKIKEKKFGCIMEGWNTSKDFIIKDWEEENE